MKKIITILTFTIIAFISSDLKAQSIVGGPTTLAVGQAEYYFYVGVGWAEGNWNWSIDPNAFWYTSEDPTHRSFLNGNEMSISSNPTDPTDINAGQLPGVVFTTTGTHYIYAHYEASTNPYTYVKLAITVVP